jgi:hypothetical protein
MDKSTDFIERLLMALPELKAIYIQHIADYDVVLPHVFMGEVTRSVATADNRVTQHDIVVRLLNFLEAELRSGDKEVSELVGVSFVENLIGEQVALSLLLPLMGPNLRREVKAICGV